MRHFVNHEAIVLTMLTPCPQAPFTLQTLYHTDVQTLALPSNTLAAVGFADKAAALPTACPVLQVGLPALAGHYCELWLSPTPVAYAKHASITYSSNGAVLFGHLLLAEADFPDLRTATRTAYQHIFELLQQAGYAYLLRVWNYFPAITAPQGGLNRYQAFCLGRQDALDVWGNFSYAPPAATAIGTQAAGLQIYFLAAQEPGMQLENPRQTSAFLYPRRYGPVSPAFSRATVKPWGQNKHVYISGTTSIVGHETRHTGNLREQLAETLRNLNALLTHGDATLGLAVHSLADLTQLKVYLHDPSTLPLIQASLAEHFARLAQRSPTVLY
ncbi:MAG: hypothetical protein ACK4RS_06035, partial [Thiothrix sp.]